MTETPWWLIRRREETAAIGPGHAEWGGFCPTHERYLLDCAAFEQLWAHAEGRCEICRAERPGAGQPLLHIDHTPAVGEWAVRGILCGGCNSTVDHPGRIRLDERQEAARLYLSEPWYLTILAAAGVDLQLPEPPPSSTIRGLKRRFWTRRDDGWHLRARPEAMTPGVRTWRWIYQRYGPHNIQLATEAAQVA